MNNDTPAKRKLLSYLKKHHPSIVDSEIPLLLHNIERFVLVIQKIYTEPQAKISFKEVKENGIKIKKRFIETNIEELKKVKRKPNEPITSKTIREFTEKVSKVKYKNHGE